MQINSRLLISVILLLQASSCDSGDTQQDNGSDLGLPSVEIVHPRSDEVLLRPANIIVEANDPSGIQLVEFIVDGDVIGSDTSGPFEFYWDASPWADNLEHSILARATDGAGNIDSDQITVKLSVDDPRLSIVSQGSAGPHFQVTVIANDTLYVDRFVITTSLGTTQVLPIGQELEPLDTIVLPSSSSSFDCADTRWTFNYVGETREGFRVPFSNEFDFIKRDTDCI